MTPYRHQKAAIEATASALTESDRCRVTMACGTGKTETAAWSAVGVGQAEVSTRVVVGVPSLNLIDQTWRRWAGMVKMPPAMAVCSDEKVGREVFRVSDYGLPSTSTDPAEIARFLAVGGPCVVFCTYQSAERLAVAMDAPGVEPFDFAICDEAHRLTGKGSQGAAFLDNGRIRATRRTFWTATPRIVRGEDVISMDDVTQFGPSAYAYTFGEAIRDGRLSQFQIVAVQVDDPRVSDALASDKGVEDSAVVVAVAKAMRDYNLRRVISFHSRVKRAAAFAAALPCVCASLPDEHRIEGVYANHIHAGTPMERRRSELARLRSADGFTLLSNAQCLGEGVDVPELDGIVFADPRTSQIEIWQAIGRAIRKSDAGKVATVLIPVFIPRGMDAEQAIENGKFCPVFDVLKAMQAHDPSMSEVIVKWSERAKGNGTGEAKDDEPLRFVFEGSTSMASALSAVVVDRSRAHVDVIDRIISRWPNRLEQVDRIAIDRIRRAGNRDELRRLECLPFWAGGNLRLGKACRVAARIASSWPGPLSSQEHVFLAGVRQRRGRRPEVDAILDAMPGWSWGDGNNSRAKTRAAAVASRWPSFTRADLLYLAYRRRERGRRPDVDLILESIPGWSWTAPPACPADVDAPPRDESRAAG